MLRPSPGSRRLALEEVRWVEGAPKSLHNWLHTKVRKKPLTKILFIFLLSWSSEVFQILTIIDLEILVYFSLSGSWPLRFFTIRTLITLPSQPISHRSLLVFYCSIYIRYPTAFFPVKYVHCTVHCSFFQHHTPHITVSCFVLFFAAGGGLPLYPEIYIVTRYTMIMQRIRTIVEDSGFEPGTAASAVWRATGEPLHL